MIYGYIYIILIREFAKNGEYIIKIGYTLNKCVFMRLNRYSYKSELIYYFYVSNPQELEKIILNTLYLEFSKEELKYFKLHYGQEYFKINVNKIYDIVYNIVKNNIIKTFNLLEDINNNKFKKLSIYFNEKINKDLYIIFCKQYIEFNYINRIDFISKIINNIIQNKIVFIENFYNYFLINNNQIEDNQIENNQIKTNQIKDNQIEDNKIKDNQIEDNQIENNQIENNQIENKNISSPLYYNKNNSFFICYKCLHMAFLKSDLNKHLNKINSCEAKCNILLTNEENAKLSLNNRFYLNKPINIKELEKEHLIIFVTRYFNKLNIISDLNNIDKNKIFNINDIEIYNEIEKIKQIKSFDDCVIVINGEKKYKCFDCKTIYKRKENLIEHFRNQNLCNKQKEINQCIKNKIKNNIL